MKKLYIVLFGAVLLIPGVVLGATVGIGKEYSLRSGETISGNLYAAGGDASLDGAVGGDALVAGGNVVMAGSVAGDVAVAGGTVNILGPVRGDLRIVGGNVVIAGDVSGDIALLGGSVHVLSGSTVGGDILAAGGKLVLDGEVKGNITAAAGELDVNGLVGGSLRAHVSDVLRLGSHADIRGNVTYKAPHEATMLSGAVVRGALDYTPVGESRVSGEDFRAGIIAFLGALFLLKLIALTVASILGVLIFKNFSQGVVEQGRTDFWKNMLRGAAILVLAPALGAFLLVTVIGSVAGVFVFLLFVLSFLIASSYAGVIIATCVHGWFTKRKDVKGVEVRWYHAALGTPVLTLIGAVPFIGWVIATAACFVALGSVSFLFYKKFWLTR
jgi:cytoskeletal protein CcmA (bactofilin family)